MAEVTVSGGQWWADLFCRDRLQYHGSRWGLSGGNETVMAGSGTNTILATGIELALGGNGSLFFINSGGSSTAVRATGKRA